MAARLIVRTAEDLRADVQEVTMLLYGFSFRNLAELLASGTNDASPGHDMAGMPGMASAPTTPPDLNDVEYDAYLVNDRTLDDPLVVRTAPGGWIRLRLINAGTTRVL